MTRSSIYNAMCMVLAFIGLGGCHLPPNKTQWRDPAWLSQESSGVGIIARDVSFGMTLAQLVQVQQKLQATTITEDSSPMLHNVTIAADGHTLRVYSGVMAGNAGFVFVFTDGHLTSMADSWVQATSRPLESHAGSGYLATEVYAARDPTLMMDLVRKLQQGPGLSTEEFCQAVRHGYEVSLRGHSYDEPVIFGPIWVLLDNEGSRREKQLRLLKQFDAGKVEPGCSIASMDQAFGAPSKVTTLEDGIERREYGMHADLELLHVPRLVSFFREGRLFAVATTYTIEDAASCPDRELTQ